MNIKKIILLILFIYIVPNTVFAEFGLKGGVSYDGFLYSEPPFSLEKLIGFPKDSINRTRFGYNLGVFYSLSLSRRISFQTDAIYSLQGTDIVLYNSGKFKLNLIYLKIPFLLNYKFLTKKRVSTGIYMGPYYGLLLKSSSSGKIWGQEVEYVVKNINKNDYGFSFGLNINLKIGKGRYLVDFRTDLGLKKILNQPAGYLGNQMEKNFVNNISLSIMIGKVF